MFPILQKSVNDEQYEIYKGPGSDGHVTSNLRIKALRVRSNLKEKRKKERQINFIRTKTWAPTSVEQGISLARLTPLSL